MQRFSLVMIKNSVTGAQRDTFSNYCLLAKHAEEMYSFEVVCPVKGPSSCGHN